jgi:hypothetical protein
MAKPPASTPHSDLDGVHEDERRNTDTAAKTGESSADLASAAAKTVARPRYSKDTNPDDRTR